MNSALLIDNTVRTGDEDIDAYIEQLESIIIAYTSDNATRMIAEANRVIGILADDLSIIAENGSIAGTRLIKEEKNNMAMDRIVKLMQQVDTISSVSKKSVDIGRNIAYAKNRDVEQEEVSELVKPSVQDELDAITEEKNSQIINGDVPAIETLMQDLKLKFKNK